MSEVTPCRGHGRIYDVALNPRTPPDTRYQARIIAAAHCARCPITCPDRITPPTSRPRKRTTTMPDTIPTSAPAAAAEPTGPQLVSHPEVKLTTEELIAWGKAHQTSRIQVLAGRAAAALHDLEQARDRETAVASAEARIERLKAQLANAEQDLRSAKGTPATPRKATSSGARPSREELRAIRTWAREHGYDVGVAGVIKREIVDAYRAAHAEQAA